MARRRGQGPQPQVKGFRPGKEPPRLRKERAKQQFGELSGAQEKLVELFAERGPEESRKLMARWRKGLVAAGVALLALAVALFTWSAIAGSVALVLAVVALVLWWQLRRQREGLEAMADAVGGRRRR